MRSHVAIDSAGTLHCSILPADLIPAQTSDGKSILFQAPRLKHTTPRAALATLLYRRRNGISASQSVHVLRMFDACISRQRETERALASSDDWGLFSILAEAVGAPILRAAIRSSANGRSANSIESMLPECER